MLLSKSFTESREKSSISFKPKNTWFTQIMAGVMLGTAGMLIAIVIAWVFGQSEVSSLFASLKNAQDNPPFWLAAPQFDNEIYLLAPTVILFLIAQGIMKLSPQPRTWSRTIVISILLALTIRYIFWRSLSTLNLSNPTDGLLGIGLLLMELFGIISSMIQLYLMLGIKQRHKEANRYSKAVEKGTYKPTVDIFIPSYNEPAFILRRTIIGCQSLDYDYKNIYLLDDTRRPQIKQLAKELGCNYISRTNNLHAKAGNLNNALIKTNGELIVVFDADFVPTKNFLKRTVGFFQNKKIGLVQTPQSFYNFDPIARNLGLEETLTSEEEVFYRQIEPIKDGAGGVVCAGTSFLVRRQALEKIGYFVTNSVCEDYFTGIRISAQGYELVYLDEKLSAGLAAESISAHIIQRLRWARGTLQAFFIESNPLTIPGLKLRQRLAHLEGLLHWFTSIPRVFFLLMPLSCLLFGINPLLVTPQEMIYIFLPYYLIQISVYGWLNMRSRSALLSDIYSLILSFPLALTVIQVILNPFTKGFKVTPKGLSRDKAYFNWNLAIPLIVFLAATLLGFFVALTQPSTESTNISIIWSIYNLLTVTVAISALIDLPKLDPYDWFNLEKEVCLSVSNHHLVAMTTKISEIGAEIELKTIPDSFTINQFINLEFIEEGLTISGTITEVEGKLVKIKFEQVSLSQYRSLVEMLFCRPGQWKTRETPGELQSLWIMVTLFCQTLKSLPKNLGIQTEKQVKSLPILR